MKCPQCDEVPISLIAYTLFGGKHIRCRNCGAQLVLKSFGKRFWSILILGSFAAVFEWFLFEKLKLPIPDNAAVFVFASTLIAVFYASLAVGWKDASVERR